jgi:hypothetical protein
LTPGRSSGSVSTDQVWAPRFVSPVDLHGSTDVVPVVGTGLLVDLDQDDARVIEAFQDPGRVDKHVRAAHGFSLM